MIIKKSKLRGQVKLSGAKNCGLKLLTASLLTDEVIEIYNSPNELLDMKLHIEMLNALGKECELNGSFLRINERAIVTDLIWVDRSIRNSLLILGALTTRFGEGKVPLPGGCTIGERKYDLHIMILQSLGAKVWEEDGYLCACSDGQLIGTEINLPFRSTGATENGIIAASLAKGRTTIWNPHIRPEIVELIKFLNQMGAKIQVYGQKCIVIDGVNKLKGTSHRVIPDNMEALTWAIGSAITDGEVEILDFPFEHLEYPLIQLRESGLKIYKGDTSLIVRGGTPYPIDISTGPYPGINSDMQPLFAVYGSISKGESRIIDLRFPGRYAYAEELGKMGVQFEVKDKMLRIFGGNKLKGTKVIAHDLRAGIALVLAGLTAEGETEIEDDWQILRGYEHFEQKLSALL